MMTALGVFLRVVSNSLANLFQKRLSKAGCSPVFLTLGVYAATAAVFGVFVFLPASPYHAGDFIANLVWMTAFGVSGNILLVLALSQTELSVFGPINSFKPLFSLIFAIFILSETPTVLQLTGIAVLFAGSFLLARPSGGLRKLFASKGVLLRFLSLALISMEAVFLKRSVTLAGPLATLGCWAFAGTPFLLAIWAISRKKSVKSDLAAVRNDIPGAAGTIISYVAMQASTLFVFAYMPVASALALFQLSSILNVLLGRKFFGEKDFGWKFAASLVMSAGAAFIVTGNLPASVR
jgi:drug/metabolite transporter (DMT)-like permease